MGEVLFGLIELGGEGLREGGRGPGTDLGFQVGYVVAVGVAVGLVVAVAVEVGRYEGRLRVVVVRMGCGGGGEAGKIRGREGTAAVGMFDLGISTELPST